MIMNTTTEQWKDIPGYENHYQVSDQGRVRSKDRIVKEPRWDYRFTKGVLMKGSPDKNGYLRYSLRKNGKQRSFTGHALVALAFIGERPDGMQILHRDDIPANNKLSNLRYGTPKDNKEDQRKNGNLKDGVDHSGSLLSEIEVMFARFIYADPMNPSIQNIADAMGVKKSAMGYAINGTTYKNIKSYPAPNRHDPRMKLTAEQIGMAIAMHNSNGLSWSFIANYFHTNTTTLRKYIKHYEKTTN